MISKHIIAQFCSTSNVFIYSICSKQFNSHLKCSNLFFRCIKRNELRNKTIEIFEVIKYTQKNSEDEFCSILLDGSIRNSED